MLGNCQGEHLFKVNEKPGNFIVSQEKNDILKKTR